MPTTITLPDSFTCRSGRILRKPFLAEDSLHFEKRDDVKDVAVQIAELLDWKGTPSREYIGQNALKSELIEFVKIRIQEEKLVLAGSLSTVAPAEAKSRIPGLDPVWEPTESVEIEQPVEEGPEYNPGPLGPVPVAASGHTYASNGNNGHTPSASNDGLAAFGALISPYIAKPDIDLQEVRQRVETELDAMGWKVEAMRQELTTHFEKLISELPARRIEIVTPEKRVIDVTEQHELYPILFRLLDLGVNVWLVGPAGSGKTTAAEKIAAELGLEYSAESVCSQTTQASLKGFINANGVYIETELYKRYANGGLILLDEFDCGNANVSNTLNAMLANDVCSFPCGMVRKHGRFVCIAASNTFGTGQTRQYVGTNQMNEATRDRFCFLEWPYDETLEARCSGGTVKSRASSNPFLAPGTFVSTDGWLEIVRRYRNNAETTKSRVVVSPRASIMGAKLLQAGFTREQCEEMLIFRGCDETTKNKIRGVA